MCDGGRVGANQRRASDSRSRLTAWLATGVPCAQPGRDVDRRTLFRPGLYAQWVELLEGALAAALDFRGWGGGGESEGRKGEERGGEERGRQEDNRTAGQQDRRTAEGRTAAEAAAGPWASARQTAPLALLLRQPEASVWSAVALRTLPTLRPTYAPNLPTFQPSVQRYSLATKPTSTAVLNPQWRQYEPITNNCCFCFARGPAFVPLCLHFHQCTTGSSRHAQRAGH